MTIKTRQDYIESLRSHKLNLWMFGEKVDSPVDHPIIIPSMNAVALTYELALDPLYEDFLKAADKMDSRLAFNCPDLREDRQCCIFSHNNLSFHRHHCRLQYNCRRP